MRQWRIVGIAVLLLAAVAAVYSQTVGFSSLRLDDWGYTAGCPFVRDGLSWKNVGRAFADFGNGAIWMPLTYLSYMLDISLFGAGWGPHHLVNVLLHGLNAILLLIFLMKTLPRFVPLSNERLTHAAGSAVLLWAIHPLCVEPVAWIAARKELLWTLFALLYLIAWHRFRDEGRKPTFALSLFFFVLACLSKPTALCLPVVALTFDAFCGRDCLNRVDEAKGVSFWASLRQTRLRPYLIFFLLSALLGFVTVFSQTNPTGFDKIDIYDTTLAWRVLNAAVALGLTLGHTIFPVGLHFDYRAVFEGWPINGVPGLVLLLVAVILWGLSFVKFKASRRLLIVAALVWLVPLIPTLGIFGIVGDHAFADRYAYLPTALLTVPLAVLLAKILHRLGWTLLLFLLVGESVVTWKSVPTFKDTLTVFSRVLKHDPDHWRALEYVGSEYCARMGRMDEGVEMLRRSLRLSPRPSSAATLAYVLALRGQADDFEEVRRLGARVAVNPKLDRGGMMLDALGIAAMREGDDKSAARYFSAALVAPRRAHGNVHALLNLGLALANTGKDREARAVLSKLSTSKDAAIRKRAAQAIKAVTGNEPYARFPAFISSGH